MLPNLNMPGTKGQCRLCKEWYPVGTFLRQRRPSAKTGKPRKAYPVTVCTSCDAVPAARGRSLADTQAAMTAYYLP